MNSLAEYGRGLVKRWYTILDAEIVTMLDGLSSEKLGDTILMNCLFYLSSSSYAAVFSKTSHFVSRSSLYGICNASSWKRSLQISDIKGIKLDFMLTRFRVQCYSARRGGRASRLPKLDSGPSMEEEKDAFYVVRKGDVVGVYKSLSDCQAQVGSSSALEAMAAMGLLLITVWQISLSVGGHQHSSTYFNVCDPPVSVYKGYSLPKEAEVYLVSRGLKNAMYSVNAVDLKEDLFGTLMPCPFQQPASSKGKASEKYSPQKRLLEVVGSDNAWYRDGEDGAKWFRKLMIRIHELDSVMIGSMEAVGSTLISTDPLRKHAKLDHYVEAQSISSDCRSCSLEFDGASKGNPGLAGAGAVLRAEDGSLVCRLREGVGIATNNVAEYRAMLLGLKYALKKGFKQIRVQGDSKLVCMQIQTQLDVGSCPGIQYDPRIQRTCPMDQILTRSGYPCLTVYLIPVPYKKNVQGLWKTKNQNMSDLCKEAKELKDKFLSFQISHALREFNSEADAQANLAIHLADGQVQEDCD
ncbi:hypothetical protein HHK36_007092 [Tetracentron sinense]|uniref:RNase H type-1 domain-containing protein n=1 Tax=Tetracentron sinense TaxID=13715 RepID=A0A834ZKA3_TETSI|nr:hypothetical protein HHK36_007092 [Tetracentron sinense]